MSSRDDHVIARLIADRELQLQRLRGGRRVHLLREIDALRQVLLSRRLRIAKADLPQHVYFD